MAEIAYEGGLRRLRIAGPCTDRDAVALRAAVEQFGRSEPRLTIDLTAVPSLAREVADAVSETVDTVEAAGCRVTILRKCASEVDVVLRALDR